LGKFLGLRKPAEEGKCFQEWLKNLPVFLEPTLGNPLLGRRSASPETVREELLPEAVVLEDVEDSDRRRNRRRAELGFEILPELALVEELLKRAAARQHAVAELGERIAAAGYPDKSRDHEEPSRELPGAPECRRPFRGVLNNIENIAEVNYIGLPELLGRPEHGVPAAA
jgi:hypothetical protein